MTTQESIAREHLRASRTHGGIMVGCTPGDVYLDYDRASRLYRVKIDGKAPSSLRAAGTVALLAPMCAAEADYLEGSSPW
jgi:hypothetical protein